MDHTDVCQLSACQLRRLLSCRALSTLELTEAVLERVDRVDPVINAFCLVDAEGARAAAARADRLLADCEPVGPLHGIPVSIKDVTHVAGLVTASGSKAFSDAVSDEDAVVVARLREAGAVIIGKTTTPEFGNKAVTDSLLSGVTRNPWKTTHVAGGSSGGAAAAVASGLGPLAEGTDGAGSVRIPASCCGVVGLKPSLGRVPVYPRNGFEGLSHEGPIARTVADAGLMLDVMAGPDRRDPNSLDASPESFELAGSSPDIAGRRIAYAHSLDGNPVVAEVSELTDRAAARLGDLGAHVELAELELPDLRRAMETICGVTFGVWAHDYALPRLDDPQQLDPHLHTLMDRGTQTSAFDFHRAMFELRNQLFQAVTTLFDSYDLLVTPTLGVAPFAQLGGPAGPSTIDGVEIDPFLGWVQTYVFNLTGHPAISVPCGLTADGLPVGLQIVAPRHADAELLRAAAAFELAEPWANLWPDVTRGPTGG